MGQWTVQSQPEPKIQITCILEVWVSHSHLIQNFAAKKRARSHTDIENGKHIQNIIFRQLHFLDQFRVGTDFIPIGISR
jgi:hypothetical protein